MIACMHNWMCQCVPQMPTKRCVVQLRGGGDCNLHFMRLHTKCFRRYIFIMLSASIIK